MGLPSQYGFKDQTVALDAKVAINQAPILIQDSRARWRDLTRV